jgi:hypothetical protein
MLPPNPLPANNEASPRLLPARPVQIGFVYGRFDRHGFAIITHKFREPDFTL